MSQCDRVEKDFAHRLGNIQAQRDKAEEVYRKEKDFLTGTCTTFFSSFSYASLNLCISLPPTCLDVLRMYVFYGNAACEHSSLFLNFSLYFYFSLSISLSHTHTFTPSGFCLTHILLSQRGERTSTSSSRSCRRSSKKE